MRSFLKSTRAILILSILAHAAGVVALLFSIGLLSFSDKKTEEPAQVVQVPQPEQPTEVGTSEVVAPTPEPRPIEQPVVQKQKPKKKTKIKSEAEVEAEVEATIPEETADVKLVTPPTAVAAKAPMQVEEDAKPVPVKEVPDGVAAQESKDADTEAKSQDVQENPEPATEGAAEKTSPSAI